MGADTAGATDRQSSIASRRWRIDPARSSVEFHVRNLWGAATVTGRFERYRGTLDLRADPAVELTIDGASLTTKNKRRDAHLRSADFFAVEAHPEVRFVSDGAAVEGERLVVRGRLEARGSSIPLRLEATLRRTGDELEVDAVTEADHRELGMTWNALGMVRSPSRLRVKARLVPDAD